MEHDAHELLGLALEAAGRPVDAATLDALEAFTGLVTRWAASANLTAHRSPAAIARHLVADAIALSGVLPEYRSCVELGSGAGLPAFPLAILEPERHHTLIEARERPHHFHRQVVRELGLGNVEPLRGRAEVLPRRAHDLAIAQAMGPPDRVAGLLAGWLGAGGHAAIPYSEQPPEVVLPADSPLRVVAPRRYVVATTGVVRSLWLAVHTGRSSPGADAG